MTSRSIAEGLAESAASAIAGKGSPSIESVGGICIDLSTVYSISPVSVQGFSDAFLSFPHEIKKRLNKTAANGMFLLKGKS
jgi:hypothetical protein